MKNTSINKEYFEGQIALFTEIKNLAVSQETYPDSVIISCEMMEQLVAVQRTPDDDGWENKADCNFTKSHRNVDFLVVTGSYSQGLTSETSDMDVKGVLDPPVWSIRHDLIVDVVQTEDHNQVLYSMRKWLGLIFDSDYMTIETLNIDSDWVIRDSFRLSLDSLSPFDRGKDEEWSVKPLQKKLLTKQFFTNCLYFAKRQIKKAQNNVLIKMAKGEFNPEATFEEFVRIKPWAVNVEGLSKDSYTLKELLDHPRIKSEGMKREDFFTAKKGSKNYLLFDPKFSLRGKEDIFKWEEDVDTPKYPDSWERGVYRGDPMKTGGEIISCNKAEDIDDIDLWSFGFVDVDREKFSEWLKLKKAYDDTKKDDTTILRVGYNPKSALHALRALDMCIECLEESAKSGKPERLRVDRTNMPDWGLLMKVKYPPEEGFFTFDEVEDMINVKIAELEKLTKKDTVFPKDLPEEIKGEFERRLGISRLLILRECFFTESVVEYNLAYDLCLLNGFDPFEN